MVASERLPPWHERHRLTNGREVLIRPIRPEDVEPLRAGFDLLEPEVLRRRTSGGAAHLAPDLAQRITRLNPKTDFVLVVTDPEPPGEAVVAALVHARTDPAGRQGEFTIVVSRFIAGLGTGRYLLTRVAKWGRSRRLERLVGDLPADNAAMLATAESLGFHRVEESTDPALIRVVFEPTAA